VNDQRRFKRYALSLPLILRTSGSGLAEETCETRNLSSGGVLFATQRNIAPGDLIEYDIALPGKKPDDDTVTLHCRGKVLRSRQLEDSRAREVAATLERYEFVRP
jgi:hypothetical protein